MNARVQRAGWFARRGMGLLRCDTDSLSKATGRRPDEKKDRSEKSRGGVGEKKTRPLFHHPDSAAVSVSKNHNVIKMEVVNGLFSVPELFARLWRTLCVSDSFLMPVLAGL